MARCIRMRNEVNGIAVVAVRFPRGPVRVMRFGATAQPVQLAVGFVSGSIAHL